MKNDTQHLEFLISQYVDGGLDAPNRKFVEQQLVTDADARAILKDQRDVQDVLDDFGSRIPLINWEEFDQKLAGRLEVEAAKEVTEAAWRLWLRPMAAAAALLVAVGVGYAWHAWNMPTGSGGRGSQVVDAPAVKGPVTDVKIVDVPGQGGSLRTVNVAEGTAGGTVGGEASVKVSTANPEAGGTTGGVAQHGRGPDGSATAVVPDVVPPVGVPR